MKKLILGLAALGIIGGGLYLYSKNGSGLYFLYPGDVSSKSDEGGKQIYSDGRGFTFKYPDSYKKDENEIVSLLSPNGHIIVSVDENSTVNIQNLSTTVGGIRWRMYEAGKDACGSRVYETNLKSSVLRLAFGSCLDNEEPRLWNDTALIQDILLSVSID